MGICRNSNYNGTRWVVYFVQIGTVSNSLILLHLCLLYCIFLNSHQIVCHFFIFCFSVVFQHIILIRRGLRKSTSLTVHFLVQRRCEFRKQYYKAHVLIRNIRFVFTRKTFSYSVPQCKITRILLWNSCHTYYSLKHSENFKMVAKIQLK